MKVLYDIQDKIEDELKQLCRKEELTVNDVECIYKMIDIVKDVTTIDAMRKAEAEGWSRDYSREYSRGYSEDYSNTYPMHRTSYDGRAGRDGDSDGRYSEGNSYARGRDSMGRYTSRDSVTYRGTASYGGHDEMIDNLKTLMMNARTEEERENYRKTIEQLTR